MDVMPASRGSAGTPPRPTATGSATTGRAGAGGAVTGSTTADPTIDGAVASAVVGGGAATGSAAAGNEAGQLVRRLRRRQRLSRTRLSERVQRVSGDPAMNPDRLRQWEAGKDVPDRYWRGWLALALGIPREVLDRAAVVTDGRRRSRSRVRAAARGRPYPARSGLVAEPGGWSGQL